MKEAIQILAEAWSDLTEETFKNCYLKTGLFETHEKLLKDTKNMNDILTHDSQRNKSQYTEDISSVVEPMPKQLTAEQVDLEMIDNFENECIKKEVELDIIAKILNNKITEEESDNEGVNNLETKIENISMQQIKSCIDLIYDLKNKLSVLDFIKPQNSIKLNSVLNDCLEKYYVIKKKNIRQTRIDSFIYTVKKK